MVNIFKLFPKFISARWIFQKPKQKKFVIYDFGNSHILFNYIKKKEAAIYYTKWEEINFYIIYYILINYGFKNLQKNYKTVFFIFVKPKIAITLMSSYVAFYKLKKQFPQLITIAIQNNVGNSEFMKILKTSKKNTLSCDYFLFFSEAFKKIYENYISIKKSIVVGSFRNNNYNFNSQNKKKILFISKINWNSKSALNEVILIRFITKYLRKNKLGKLDICLKSNDISVLDTFEKSIGHKSINLIPKKNNYSLMKYYENIIFTDSTLGYECLARGKKVISFALGSLKKKWCIKNNFQPINKFGYPNEFRNEGFCWSNSCSEKRINKLLKNIIFMKQSKFNQKIKATKKKIMSFDTKNTKFKRLLNVL